MLKTLILSLLLATTAIAADSEAFTFARQLGIGWNLGNTLEATGIKGTTVQQFETAWGNPVTTKQMIDGIRATGFKTIRIPVGWSNLMAPDYTINPDLMNRVEEVAKYALDNDMYVIINVHWDGGWITKFPKEWDPCMAKYTWIWMQIADRFKTYSDHVIFESMNEEGCFDDLWNRYGGQPANKEKAYDILNVINQEFTDILRNSGGNNAGRYLLIAGYATDINCTADPLFKMPSDPAKHSMVSVHYYSPPGFAILDKDASWGKAAYTWGTRAEQDAVKQDMEKMKRFTDAGIPVVVGEYGCPDKKDPASIVRYITTVCETASSMGYIPVFWDAGNFYDRKAGKFRNPALGDEFARIAATKRP
jgi:endoglucanase